MINDECRSWYQKSLSKQGIAITKNENLRAKAKRILRREFVKV